MIVAGGRDFDDYEKLSSSLDYLLQNKDGEIEVISGMARGADRLGEQYARERGYRIMYMPAEWDKYGNAAGYRRNAAMAEYADALVAFWDGKSPGTRHMIQIAKSKGLNIRVKRYKNGVNPV